MCKKASVIAGSFEGIESKHESKTFQAEKKVALTNMRVRSAKEFMILGLVRSPDSS